MRPTSIPCALATGLLLLAGSAKAQYDDPPVGGDPDPPAGCAGVQAKVTLDSGALAFLPSPVVVAPGQPVCWTWSGMTHNVRADDGSFGSGPPTSSGNFQKTFSQAGTYNYHCQIHGNLQNGMRGTVIVQSEDPGPNTGPGTIQVGAGPFEITEGAGPASVVLERIGGGDGKATVRYSSASGSAKINRDFNRAKNVLVTWNSGEQGPRTIQIGVKNDSARESDETFSVKLTQPSGAPLGPSIATVIIHDNDSPSCSAASLSAPANLRATGQSGREIALAWGAEPAAATSFRLERRSVDSAFHEIAAVAPGLGKFVDFGLPAATTFLYRLRAEGPDGFSTYSDIIAASTDGPTTPCAAHASCLHDGRFEAMVDWRADTREPRRAARRLPLGDSDSFGLFSLSPGEPELLLAVSDGCAENDHYGLALATASEAELLVRVRDTTTGHTWVHFNPEGSSVALRDVDAFGTCP